MFNKYLKLTLLSSAFAIFWSTGFLFTSIGIQASPHFHFVALKLITGTLFILLVFPTHIRAAFSRRGAHPYYAAIGIFGIAVPSIMEVWKRYSFGPPYTDTLFLMILAPVLIAIISTLMNKPDNFLKFIGVIVSLLGSINILASWEQPSTFAPLARYAAIEWPLLITSLCAAFLIIVGKRSCRKWGVIETAMGSSAYAAIAATLLALTSGFDGFSKVIGDFSLAIASIGTIGYAVPLLIILWMAKDYSATSCSSAFLLVPVAFSGITFFESTTGITGANPLLAQPIKIGIIVTALGLALTWQKETEPAMTASENSRPPGYLAKSMIIIAVIALFLSIAALAQPAINGHIKGLLEDGSTYMHDWQINRYETTGGWMLLLSAILLLVLSLKTRKEVFGMKRNLAGYLGAFLLFWANIKAGDVVIINWYSWMPPEIYHTLGTSYTKMTLIAIPSATVTVIGLASGISLLLAIASALFVKKTKH